MKAYRYTVSIDYLVEWSKVRWDTIEKQSLDEEAERLYTLLHELRMELIEVVKHISIETLHRFPKTLHVFKENIDSLPRVVQQEIELYFSYENIEKKIKEHRNLIWNDIIRT